MRVATGEPDAVRVVEHRRLEEAEDGVDAAIVQEAEAADLIALVAVVARVQERDRRHAEHADLLVQVPQVRDLHDLLFVLEARVAVGAEVALTGIGHVAAVAVEAEPVPERDAVGAPAAEEEIAARLLIDRERVVERAHGIRRQRHREGEVGEGVHVARVDGSLPAEQSLEGDDEVVERERLVGADAEEAVGAVAAPVHRAAVPEAAQGLRGHGALHGMELVDVGAAVHVGAGGDRELDGHRARRDVVVGIAEIPRQLIEIAEDVTARARRFAVAGRDRRVVQHRAAGLHDDRLRVVDRDVGDFLFRRGVDHGDGVVEAREDVEAGIGLVEHQPRRPPAAHHDVIRRARHERVVLERRRVEDADLARAERGDVERRAVRADRHADRRRETLGDGARRTRHHLIVDVLVQVARRDRRPVQYGDARLGEMPAHRG